MSETTAKETKLCILVPCYNEAAVLDETRNRLCGVLDRLHEDYQISKESFICFVDDGSSDETWNLIETYHQEDPRIRGVKLSKNQGHQLALWAGYKLLVGKVDCCLSMDADLQDDPEVAEQFIEEYYNGHEVVYGVRKDRSTDTFMKRMTAHYFYNAMRMLGADIVYGHADYRLLGAKALKALTQFNEFNLFLRGVVPLVGFKSTRVYYERKERFSGDSKYPYRIMIEFAIEGVTSFSVTPLRLVASMGGIVILMSFVLSALYLYSWLGGSKVPAWVPTVLPIYFIGGVQLLCLGIVAEYVGKIYKEVKGRPKYFVEKDLL